MPSVQPIKHSILPKVSVIKVGLFKKSRFGGGVPKVDFIVAFRPQKSKKKSIFKASIN